MPKPTKKELDLIFGHPGPKYFDRWFSIFTGYQRPADNFIRFTNQKSLQKKKVEFHKPKTRKKMRKRMKKSKRKLEQVRLLTLATLIFTYARI